ncbi:YchJ family protein [Lysobacter antibioticus]|uniref:YchJ family protein n=1 Tax=Lysobacter antibioticus TaxID=84531 RepID=UPI00034CEED1|nr:YchJ family metal-binding protein [Lysobacter antibioticus]
MTARIALPAACPCDPARRYAACCGRLHRGDPAESAEALMRSRYSAYVLGDLAYLRTSWHPTTCPDELEFDPAVRWLGLEVKRHRQDGADTATVEFVARYRVGGGSAVRLHEISRFARVDGGWRYLDGTFPQG